MTTDAEDRARLGALHEWWRAAPSPDDEATPRAQERAGIEQSQRLNRWRRLEVAIALKVKKTRLRAPLGPVHGDLAMYEARILPEIEAREAHLTDENRERVRFEDGTLRVLHESLHAVRFGIPTIGNMEIIPAPLYDFLVNERGWRPERGERGIWRGSLVTLGERIAELDAAIGEAQTVIDAEMAQPLEVSVEPVEVSV